MNRTTQRLAARWTAWLLALAILATPIAGLAQTQIKLHSNKYKTSDDVQLGRQAAAEVEQQMPLLRDAEVQRYVESVGQDLAAAIPPEFQHPEFRYSFKVVNARDINALLYNNCNCSSTTKFHFNPSPFYFYFIATILCIPLSLITLYANLHLFKLFC